MSTLNVSNITDGTTTVGTSYVVNGSAKAWVMYNGDTSGGSVLDSNNISSVTDTASGIFRTNLSSSMSNSNYSSVGMSRVYHINSSANDDKTATGEEHQSFYVSGTGGQRTSYDLARNAVVYHGDLA